MAEEGMRSSGVAASLWTLAYLGAVALPLLVLFLPPGAPGLGFWWDLSMAFGFAGLAVIGVQFWLTARFKRMSAPFGMDILYYFHRWVAVGGLLLVLAHFAVLRTTAADSLRPVLPPAAPWHMTAGRVALLLMLVLVVSSLWRKQLRLEYDRWRIAHAAMAVAALLLAVWHVAGTAYYTGTPFKRWTWILYVLAWAGLVAYIRAWRPWRLLQRPWRVTHVQPEPGRSWTLTLEPEGHEGIHFQPGQFAWLTLRRSPFAAAEHPFSFSSSAALRDSVRFTIKELGDFTNTIGTTAPGTIAYVDGPYGVFTPDRHPDAPGFVLIAGGVGIAPLMSMLRTFADRGESRPITLVYANNRLEDVLFREELEALQGRLQLRVVHVLLEPPDGWAGEHGFVDRLVLHRALPPERSSLTYFICGPKPMTDAVEWDLRTLDVPLRRIHIELFDMA
jgi:predicted ferric reductase